MSLAQHFKIIVISGFVTMLWSCKESTNKTTSANQPFALPDNLFVLHNIKGSYFQVDSITQSKFVAMDTIQKNQLITTSTIKESPQLASVDKAYIVKYMRGAFISRQDQIGDFQPIVISLEGDDYHALVLILLDKDCKPVSQLLLSGGFEAGPDDEIGDSLILVHDRESIINNDEIKTYILHLQQSEKSDSIPAQIDSISYTMKILPTGKIDTIKKDSTRYARIYNWPKHCW